MKRPKYSPAQVELIEKRFISFSAIGLFIATIIVLFFMLYMNMLRGYTNDFRAFYTGALMVRYGETQNLYSFSRQYHWQQSFNPLLQKQTYTLLFMNPPFVALFLVPLTLLPEHVSYLIWGGVNLFFLSIICFIIFTRFRHLTWQLRYAGIAMVLLFVPICEALAEGQFSILLTLALLMTWVCLRNNKQSSAGVALAALIIKPQLIFLPALIFLWKFKKAFISLFLTLVLLFGISLGMGGIRLVQSYVQFLSQIPHWNNIYGIFPLQQNSWAGIVSLLIPQRLHIFSQIMLILGDMIALGVLLWSFSIREKDYYLFDLQYGLLLLVTLLTSMHMGLHDLSILIIPLAITGLYATSSLPLQYKKITGVLPFIGYGIIFIDFICMLCNFYVHLSTFFIIFLTVWFTLLIYSRSVYLQKK